MWQWRLCAVMELAVAVVVAIVLKGAQKLRLLLLALGCVARIGAAIVTWLVCVVPLLQLQLVRGSQPSERETMQPHGLAKCYQRYTLHSQHMATGNTE